MHAETSCHAQTHKEHIFALVANLQIQAAELHRERNMLLLENAELKREIKIMRFESPIAAAFIVFQTIVCVFILAYTSLYK